MLWQTAEVILPHLVEQLVLALLLLERLEAYSLLGAARAITALEVLRVVVAGAVLLAVCLALARLVVWQTSTAVAAAEVLVLAARATTQQTPLQAQGVRVVLATLGLLAALAETVAQHLLPVLLAQMALVVAAAGEHLLQAPRAGLVEPVELVLNFLLLRVELLVLAVVVVAVVAVALALPVLAVLER